MPEQLERNENGKVKPKGFSVLRSFKCAWTGVMDTFKGRNFKIQLGFGAAALVLAAVFQIPVEQWLIIVVCAGMVLGLECINTAIESVVDLVSPEWNGQARIAKDAAAGAALLASIASFIVGVMLFAPRILAAVGLL